MESDKTSCLQVVGWMFISAFKTGSDVANDGLISCILLIELTICFVSVIVFIQFDSPPQMGSTINTIRITLLVLLSIGTLTAFIKCCKLFRSFPNAENKHVDKYIVFQIVIIFVFGIVAVGNDALDIYFDIECIQKRIPYFETLKPDLGYNTVFILFNIMQMFSMVSVLLRKVDIERMIYTNYGIMLIIVANASVFLCSIINQEIKFLDTSTQSNDSNKTNNSTSCYSPDDVLYKFKNMINPFEILFSFLAIGFLISKSTPPAATFAEENQGLISEDDTITNYHDIGNSVQYTEVSKCSRIIGYCLTWSILGLTVVLILYLLFLLFDVQWKDFVYVKKFIQAPLLWIVDLLAFWSLKHKYSCDSMPLKANEKILLAISPFIFMYEIFKLIACIFCNFDTISTTILSETKISGEIVEAVFFIIADFFQTNLIIQANRSSMKLGKEYLSFPACCIVLFIMNVASFVIDILGVFGLQPLAVIQETCYGDSLHILIINITARPIIVYRLICAGFFLVLYNRYKKMEHENVRRSCYHYFFC